MKFGRREIGEKNFAALLLKLSLLRGSRPKSARVSLQQCAQSAADFVQIGSLWAEFIVERVNTAKTRRKVNQYSAEA